MSRKKQTGSNKAGGDIIKKDTSRGISSTAINIIRVTESERPSQNVAYPSQSEPPIGREADTIKDVFETVWHHRAECGGRPQFYWRRVYG